MVRVDWDGERMKTTGLKGIIPLCLKVIYFIGKRTMPSKNGVMVYLKEEDKKLFEKAVEKYKMGQSELLKKIVGNWLFQNKLQIENKNG